MQPPPVLIPRVWTGSRWIWIAAFLLTLIVQAGWIAFAFDADWYPADDGNYAHVAERLVAGEVLQRDVQDVHAGYVNFANAGALKLFGPSLRSLRWPIALMALCQGAWVFALFRRRGPWGAAFASLIGSALGPLQFFNPTAHWYGLFLFFALVVLLTAARVGERGRVELVGLLIGTLFLFRQLSGVLLAIGAVIYLLLEMSESRSLPAAKASAGEGSEEGSERGGRGLAVLVVGISGVGLLAYLAAATDRTGWILFGLWPLGLTLWAALRVRVPTMGVVAMLSRLAAGSLVAAVPLLIYHGYYGTWGIWIDDIVQAPRALIGLDFIGKANFGVLMTSGFAELLGGEGVVARSNGLYWVLLSLLAPILGAGSWAAFLRRPATAVRGRALPFLAVFWAVVAVHYQIPVYLYYIAGPALVALLWLRADLSPKVGRAVGGLAVFLAVIGLASHAGQSGTRPWEQLIAGERRALVASSEIERVGLRIPPQDLEAYGLVLDKIDSASKPGEPIFVVPTNAELYFLADRPNPTRFFNFALGVRDDQAYDRLIESFRKDPPSLVLFRRDDKYNTLLSQRFMGWVEGRSESLGWVGPFEVYRPFRDSDSREDSQGPDRN